METNDALPGESYRTTGEFEHLDRGYRRHCGPTAVTNLILTLLRRAGLPAEEPREVFRTAAALGRRRLIYGNFDLLGRFGGTSDLLSPLYLRAVLRRYGLERFRVGGLRPLRENTLESALRRGSVLYLQTHRHRRYGSHHLLCYGAYRSPETGEWLLRLADGWAPRCTVLPLRELPRCSFVPVWLPGQTKKPAV